MKNSQIFTALIVIFFTTSFSFCQNTDNVTKSTEANLAKIIQQQDTRFSLSRKIMLKPNDSKSKDITLNINKKTEKFFLNISCEVKVGSLTVKIYDPNGDKQGEFSVESQMKDEKYESGIISIDNINREIVEGNISKEIKNPVKGNWIIKLIPKKTHARISINSQFRERD